MNNPNTNDLAPKPWYKEFWFWFIFGPLIFIICFCVSFTIFAFKHSDDVVTDNYYKEGLMINQVLKQDEVAAARFLSAEVRFDKSTHEVTLELTGQGDLPKNLILFLDNTAKSAKDTQIELTEITAGHYRGDYNGELQFAWYLSLVPATEASQRKTAEWLLTGFINLSTQDSAKIFSRVAHPMKKSDKKIEENKPAEE